MHCACLYHLQIGCILLAIAIICSRLIMATNTCSHANPYYQHAFGEAFLFCTSPSCKNSAAISKVSISSVPAIPGCGQYRCGRCNRLFLICLTCPQLTGNSSCFLVEGSQESTFYSRLGRDHFFSSAHLSSLSSADSPPPFHRREEFDAEDQNHSFLDDDDDNINSNSASESFSGEVRMRGLLNEHGLDPRPLDFSDSGLFPNMPAAARYFGDIHNNIGFQVVLVASFVRLGCLRS